MPLYQLTVHINAAQADALSDWLEPQALAVAIDLLEDERVLMSATFDGQPDAGMIATHLALLQAFDAELTYNLVPVPLADWLALTGRSLGAGDVGGFRLLDAPTETTRLVASRDLAIESFGAFGDGYHATTQGCLAALSWLAPQMQPRAIADIGCGSGVLALAAHKLWPQARVTASDLDPRSVATTRRNRQGNAGQALRVTGGPGFAPRAIGQGAPYDLILMNILARPLSRLAAAAGRHMAPGGMLVLSGLLQSQLRLVLAAYRAQRLALVKQSVQDGWMTLILRRTHK